MHGAGGERCSGRTASGVRRPQTFCSNTHYSSFLPALLRRGFLFPAQLDCLTTLGGGRGSKLWFSSSEASLTGEPVYRGRFHESFSDSCKCKCISSWFLGVGENTSYGAPGGMMFRRIQLFFGGVFSYFPVNPQRGGPLDERRSSVSTRSIPHPEAFCDFHCRRGVCTGRIFWIECFLCWSREVNRVQPHGVGRSYTGKKIPTGHLKFAECMYCLLGGHKSVLFENK